MPKCLIEDTKKRRVIGTNGPRRHELKPFSNIDSSVPQTVVDEILSIASNYTENDLGGDSYQISQHCNLETAFKATGEYRQILLQQSEGNDIIDETGYSKWRTDIDSFKIQEYFSKTFGKTYRARISVMPPGHDLNWHIDTDTSVLCRVQIAAQTEGSEFQFKTKEGKSKLIMKPGNAYFVNTGWTHRVINTDDYLRIVLIAGVMFDDIPNNDSIRI